MFNIIALIQINDSGNANVIQQIKQSHFFLYHMLLQAINKAQTISFYHC